MEFFATCPTGFERTLARELDEIETPRTRPLQGQVSFEGDLACAYKACLWSRIASRVVLVVGRGHASNSDELFEFVGTVPWEEHIPRGATFAVDAQGTNDQLRSTQFVAQRAKDAIVDSMRARAGVRPTVNAKSPDVRVVVRVSKTRASVGIDLTGDPLFHRGYQRSSRGRALRADYAAALVWTATNGMSPTELAGDVPWVLDATWGASILLVEAAGRLARRAPGLLRLRWGFARWAQHDSDVWQDLVDEAHDLALEAPPELFARVPHRSLEAIRDALRSSGITSGVRNVRTQGPTGPGGLLLCDLTCLPQDDLALEASSIGTLARDVTSLEPTYLGVSCRDELVSSYVVSESPTSLRSILGKDGVQLLSLPSPAPVALSQVDTVQGRKVAVLESSSDQFAARLRKNARLRRKWAAREDVMCYRVFDADLPDYAVAIDLFQGSDPITGEPDGRRWLNVAEYAAPKEIDADRARRRLVDALVIAQDILDIPERNAYLHVRRHGKGGSQYFEDARKAHEGKGKGRTTALPPGAHLVEEGGLTFEVNFSLRHDCGIFLDHRDTRALIRELAKQTKGSKRFLNLFAYTGTATCYAADGGMYHTTTVDMSRPSLEWARRNMERNGFVGKAHEYVQADVLTWVSEQRHSRNRWDLVFCDVPTFSNSKRMGRKSFDVQRDHAELLIDVSRLLTRSGTCVFSCNLRTFSPNMKPLEKAGVHLEDITQRTIPYDFERNQRVHHTYLLTRA